MKTVGAFDEGLGVMGRIGIMGLMGPTLRIPPIFPILPIAGKAQPLIER
jgi:hypothetical protein